MGFSNSRFREQQNDLAVLNLLVPAEDAVELVATDFARRPDRSDAADLTGAGHLADNLIRELMRDFDHFLKLVVRGADERRH